MKIALVAPPFIAVPPKKYGGTESFIATLAGGLKEKGVDVVLYANGASTAPVKTRWIFEKEDWPLRGDLETSLKGLNHSSWAVKEASREADIIHLNSAPGLSHSRFVNTPIVYTVHHPFEPSLTEFYRVFPDVYYVTISDFQRRKLPLRRIRTIHHGIDIDRTDVKSQKRSYLAFLGRIAPSKGTHLAVEIAQKADVPLKIGGEIQPIYKNYWETQVKPHVDGKFIEYVGEVGYEDKCDFLGGAVAMLFPIQWDEPFGLVQIEAMACGTPVLALPGGSVEEIVKEGVSGCVRQTPGELAECAKNLKLDPESVRSYVLQNFSVEHMVQEYIRLYSEIISERERKADRERIVA